MKFLSTITLLCLVQSYATAQFKTEWATSMGGEQVELVYDMERDSEGNLILLGHIDGYINGITCDLDPGPNTTAHTNYGDDWGNIFLAKYDSLGNHLWSFALWDEWLAPEPNKLTVDDQDNIYITGTLSREIDFDPGPDTFILDANDSDFDTVFAAKYSPEGGFIWADIYDGVGSGNGMSISYNTNNIYLCGNGQNTIYSGFNDTTTIANSSGDYYNGYLSKYNTDMTVEWSIPVAQGNGLNNIASSLDVGTDQSVYVAGVFESLADFDPTTEGELTLFSPVLDYSADMFIAKYNDEGEIENAVQIGSNQTFERIDQVYDVTVDLEGNVLVTGWYTGTLDFDPSDDVFNLTGENDIFLAKYTSDLELLWAFTLAGTYYDIGKEITIDEDNNILLFGQYYWNGDFDPGPQEFILSGDWQNAFLGMYDPNGNFITAITLPLYSSFGYQMFGVELGDAGAIYLSGVFSNQYDFDLDEDDEILLTSAGSSDIVLGKFKYYDPITPYLESVSPSQVLANSAVTLSIAGYNMEQIESVSLHTSTDTIFHQELLPISEFELDVLFGIEEVTAGYRDLHVQLTDTLLILTQGVEVLPNELNYANAAIDYLSAQKVLLNRPEPSISLVRNTGNIDLVTFPVIYRSIYDSLKFENIMPYEDLRDHEEFEALSTQLIALGEDDNTMNDIIISSEEGKMVSMIIPHLTAQDERLIQLRLKYTDLTISDVYMVAHANGLLGSEALLPDYTPEPTACAYEMMAHAIELSAPGLDLTDLESCFSSSYSQLQNFLYEFIQSNENEQKVIPLKGLMMKTGLDIIQCLDPAYNITTQVLDSIAVDMTRLMGNPILFEPGFDCSDYLEVADLFRQSLEAGHEKVISIEELLEKDTGAGAVCAAAGISIGYGCGLGNNQCIEPVSSLDPNEKYGPVNIDSGTKYINYKEELFYDIHFENDSTALTSAKQVLLVDSLDTEVYDLTSVKFLYAQWGDSIVNIEAGTNFIDLRPTQPNILKITALTDTVTGVLTCDFETLDTLTMLLTFDLDHGFLPPNLNSPEGMGSISFTIDLKEDIASNTAFQNDALIYFDYNDPILTDAWPNVYDVTLPNSHVSDDFTALTDDTFMVNWEPGNTDDPCFMYAIYVSENSPSDWQLWKDFTTEPQAEYTGTLGSTYYFYSLALDSAMNLEVPPLTYDAAFTFLPDAIDEHSENSILLWPNPSNDLVNIKLNSPEWESLEVFDLNGRLVSQSTIQGEQQLTIDLSDLPLGVYALKVNSKQNQVTRTFIKQ